MNGVPALSALNTRNSFAQLPPAFYSRVKPQPLTRPRLLHANTEAAHLIGLDPRVMQTSQFLRVFSGSEPLPGGHSLAAVYSGHQFGMWAGQLGDGRAHLLGEVHGPGGVWELQLKGSGMTPYSRMGDGRAVLRSSVREYLASEAMHGLGIPTTRVLALVVADDPVMRETVETAAVITRMSPSFVRFGSFEHWGAQGQTKNLRILIDYIIDHFYPECRQGVTDQTEVWLRFFQSVTQRTAQLIAAWQAVGFCHGVMNTDNMSILGLTLDYGPYGFMDAFQLGHICNHSDTQGRYTWDRQPSVALWNLYRLAESLYPLVPDAESLRGILDGYESFFTQAWYQRMAAKLGLEDWQPSDKSLVDGLLSLMHHNQADFTLVFRRLSGAVRGQQHAFADLFRDRTAAYAWLHQLLSRHGQDNRDIRVRAAAMDRINPLYVLRNHLAERAISAAKEEDASEIDTLLKLLRNPYAEQPGFERYASVPPDEAASITVSCSS